jgi:hypothetical protein
MTNAALPPLKSALTSSLSLILLLKSVHGTKSTSSIITNSVLAKNLATFRCRLNCLGCGLRMRWTSTYWAKSGWEVYSVWR